MAVLRLSELFALQDLLHQNTARVHSVDRARGWRWSQLVCPFVCLGDKGCSANWDKSKEIRGTNFTTPSPLDSLYRLCACSVRM